MKKNNIKKFREFIEDTVTDILLVSDLPSHGIEFFYNEDKFSDQDDTKSSTDASIVVSGEYQEFDLHIYKPLYLKWSSGGLQQVRSILCHEIGHVHTHDLHRLADSAFKTEEEVRRADEQLATKIGLYLLGRLGDHDCLKKPKQKRKNKKP